VGLGGDGREGRSGEGKGGRGGEETAGRDMRVLPLPPMENPVYAPVHDSNYI